MFFCVAQFELSRGRQPGWYVLGRTGHWHYYESDSWEPVALATGAGLALFDSLSAAAIALAAAASFSTPPRRASVLLLS